MSICDLKGKKLLILAGAGVHNKVVRAAKELGVYTIVTDYLADSPAKKLADEEWLVNITDVEAIVQKCKEENVDGVMNFCIDPAQIPYQQICERLGVPCIGTKATFEILTDKRKFKDYCQSHNVDVIPEYTFDDIVAGRVKYPVLIKPTINRGSRCQSVCCNKEEAIRGVELAKAESKDGGFVCEKYMDGHQDIGSAFFVVDGEPYLVKIGDRTLGSKKDGLERQVVCTQLPSNSTALFESNVMSRVKDMIKSLGIQYGPVFLQGFVDGDTIRFYDPAQRMPGGDYDIILEKVTGFSTVKSWIHFALTGDIKSTYGNPDGCYRLNDGVALLLTITVKPGVIQEINGLEAVARLPYVVYTRQILERGTVVRSTGDISQRAAAIGIFLDDKKEIADCVKKIYDIYQILGQKGENMIITKIPGGGQI